jgi:hypothetical protein
MANIVNLIFMASGLTLLITGGYMLWGGYSLLAGGVGLIVLSILPTKTKDETRRDK